MVTIVGLIYTLFGTVAGIAAVRALTTTTKVPAAAPLVVAPPRFQFPDLFQNRNGATSTSSTKMAVATPPAPAFSEAQWQFFWTGTCVTSLLTVALALWSSSDSSSSSNPLFLPGQALALGLGTVAAYLWGTRLPAAVVSVVHPLVSASLVVWLLTQLLAQCTGQDFATVLATYKRGTLHPLRAGAADYFFYILGPAVVSFAMSMYSRRRLLFGNLPMVLTAAILSSAGGLFSTAAVVRLLQIGGSDGAGSAVLRLSCLARNITTALALAVTEILGGDIALVAAVVSVTGILGASYGKKLLNAAGVTDPILRGLGIGSSSQGLGVASLADEPDAFPFAAMSMVLTAVSATILVSVPSAKHALIRVATGTMPTP